MAPNATVQPNSGGVLTQQVKEKKPHIKKPLNAFMLFMKQKRADVIKECTLKESAAINQILGKMVGHGLVGRCGHGHIGGVTHGPCLLVSQSLS